MKSTLTRIAIGAGAFVIAAGIVHAQAPASNDSGSAAINEISVTASRQNQLAKPVVSKVSMARFGTFKKITLNYVVSPAGLDLSTSAGASELEKRVNDTAMAVCREIGHQYPGSIPDDEHCAKTAADEAMISAHKMIAAASKGTGK